MPAEPFTALLVEDDDDYAELLRIELGLSSRVDIEVERARTLRDAVASVRAGPYDAVVLDLGLPDSAGLDTFEQMQSAARDVPILVLTGRDDESMAVAAMQAGAQDYLVKGSVDAEIIVRALRYARERAQFRRQLLEREAHFRALVDHSHETIMLLDPRMVCSYVSRAVTGATGYVPEDLVGHRVDRFAHPEDVPALRATMARALEEPGTAHSLEYRLFHKDGSVRFGEAIVVNHLETPGVRSIVANHRDVTARKLTEQALLATQDRLRQAHKMEAVGRLAGGIAHDFNNVLTAIFGYTDLLIDQIDPDDPRRRDVQEIRRSADRAATLTRQLLAFSRKQVLQRRLVDVAEVLGNLHNLLSRLLGEQVRLEIVTATGLWTIKADPGQLEQVLMNLCVNARDAMPDGGTVRLALENRMVEASEAAERLGLETGDYVVITVADSGQGIPAALEQQIFEPFFTTKEQGKGTGLGLSTVYGIVKQSGGGIYVHSAEGRGATFSIYLPRAEVAGDASAAGPGSGPTSSL